MEDRVAGNPNQHTSLVVVNRGKELLVVETDNGTVVSGTAQQ